MCRVVRTAALCQMFFAADHHRLELSLSLAETLGDPGANVAALNILALAWGAAGETDRALVLAEEAMAHLKQAAAVVAEIAKGDDSWQPQIWKPVEW